MKLYDYAASANCYKVRLLLAQLSRDYERVAVDIFAGDTLTDEFAAVNPIRTTPVLEDPPGTFLQESNAILLHLARGTDLLQDDPQVYRWLFYEQADVVPTMGGLRFRLITGRLSAATRPANPRPTGMRMPCSTSSSIPTAARATSSFVTGSSSSTAHVSTSRASRVRKRSVGRSASSSRCASAASVNAWSRRRRAASWMPCAASLGLASAAPSSAPMRLG